jgi:hypothetical protein
MSYIRPDFSIDSKVNSKLASLSYDGKSDVVDGYLEYDSPNNVPGVSKIKLDKDRLILSSYKSQNGIPYIIYVDTNGVIHNELAPLK